MTAVECTTDACYVAQSPYDVSDGPCITTMHHVRRAIRHAQMMTWKQLLYCAFCVFLVLFGAAGQVIVLNLWLKGFPQSANAPFTVLVLSSSTSLVIYLIGLAIWCAIRRPSLRFLLTRTAVLLELADGGTSALQGLLLVSATQFTPELLQAFLLSTVIVWTFLFMKLIFKEERSYCSPLVIASFVLSLAGLLVGSASKFGGTGMTTSAACWTVLFAVSVVPGALNSVVAAKFMRHFTLKDEELEEQKLNHLQQPEGAYEAVKSSSSATPGECSALLLDRSVPAPLGTDSATAKGVRLACSTFVQTVLICLLLPTSAIPWFGSYATVSESIVGLGQGFKCTFNLLPGCGDALTYFLIFNACFAAYNVGIVILTYYSPAMTSMISQLVSPLTAVILMAFPAWNVAGTTFNVPESVLAVILIAVGAVLYTIWEESTGHSSPDPAASPTAASKAPHTPR